MRSSSRTARRRRVFFFAVAVATAGAFTERRAEAQARGFALDRFDPAPAGDAFFGVASPHVFHGPAEDPSAFSGEGPRPAFELVGDYARSPLVLRDGNGDEIGKLVSDQLFLHANASIGLAHRVLFHVDVPFAAVTTGESPTIGNVTLPSPSGVALGDIRLGARLRALGEWRDPLQIAFNLSVWLPTGSQDAYAGDGSAHALASAIVGGRAGDVTWTTNLGFHLRPEREVLATPVRDELVFGAGLALLAAHDTVQIGPEIHGTTAVGGDRSLFAKETTTGEVLLGAKYRSGPWVVGLAGGPGLGVGLGTPAVRGVVSIGYAPWGEGEKKEPLPVLAPPPPPPPKDTDADSNIDKEDACPTVKGVASPDPKKNGCPPDADEDGIVDADDACPTEKGLANPNPNKNGCPDSDADGIIDKEDACPTVKGVPDADPKKNGCPPDTDGDGIVDAEDACPEVAGPADPDPKKNGCPKVILTKKAIVITEQIHFEYNKARILPDSDTLLAQIAQVLKDHPEIKKISIEGHTDNVGGATFNLSLSQKRADAVRAWLVMHGIEKARLATKGFGLSKPIGDNKTEEGREKNRRVEFRIVDPAPPKDEK